MSASRPAGTRRDALVVLACGFVGVGGLAALWPLVDQMNPNSSTPRDSLEVDLGAFDATSLKLANWKGEPFLIRRRTPEEIAIARSVQPAAMIDSVARVASLGDKDLATDDNRTQAGYRQWLVVAGACTRCACLLKDGRSLGLDAADAFFCACCASRFDLAGRVRSGPARLNLFVPSYRFIGPDRLEIGRWPKAGKTG